MSTNVSGDSPLIKKLLTKLPRDGAFSHTLSDPRKLVTAATLATAGHTKPAAATFEISASKDIGCLLPEGGWCCRTRVGLIPVGRQDEPVARVSLVSEEDQTHVRGWRCSSFVTYLILCSIAGCETTTPIVAPAYWPVGT